MTATPSPARARVRSPIVALLALASVVPIAAPTRAQTARDSAGVRIVEYPRNSRAAAQWRVDLQPVLSFGGASGTGPAELTTVTTAVRTASGYIVIGNAGTQEIRVFDERGTFVRSIGRSGLGPGEFAALEEISVIGDTVYAADGGLSASVFTLAGAHVRDVSAGSVRPWIPSNSYGALASGAFVGTANPLRNSTRLRTSPDPAGHFTDTSAVYVIGPKPWEVRVITAMRGFEMFRGPDQAMGSMVPFSAVPYVALFDWRICLAHSRTYEVRCLRDNGQLDLVVRRDVPQLPIADSVKAAYVASLHAPQPGPERAPSRLIIDQTAARMEYARAYPVFSLMAGARSTGEVWIGDFRPRDRLRGSGVGPTEQRTWNVFGPDGSWRSTVALPARFQLTDAGIDYVLGVLRDNDDVETVVMYRLQRSAN